MNKKRKGFSIIEVLLALTIFSIVTIVGVNTFITSYRSAKSAALENVLLEDARYILKRLEAEVRNNNLDFEEYFNRKVVQSNLPEDANLFAQNHGLYAWQFFDGGRDPATGDPDGIGTWCQDAGGNYLEMPNVNCVTGALAGTEDNSTGRFPINRIEPDDTSKTVEHVSSVCVPPEVGYYDFNDAILPAGDNGCSSPDLSQHYAQSELNLISQDDQTKTLIKPRTLENGQTVLAMSKMIAQTTVNNRLKYNCAPDFPCEDINGDTYTDPDPTASRGIFDDFIPISPLRTNIKNITFIISPLEDPNLAFSENFASVQMQPQVTILLTVEPVGVFKNLFLRKNLEIHLQTTTSTKRSS